MLPVIKEYLKYKNRRTKVETSTCNYCGKELREACDTILCSELKRDIYRIRASNPTYRPGVD